MNINIITIPKALIKEEELVLIARSELEKLLKFARKEIREVSLTSPQKKALQIGRQNKIAGNFLSIDELKAHLDRTN